MMAQGGGNRVETRNTLFGKNIEYFNGTEWKKISEYKNGEKILTFFLDDRHVELLQPIKYIKRKSEGLNRFIAKGSKMDICLSDDAEFIGQLRSPERDSNGEKIYKYSNQITNFALHEANDNKFSNCLLFNTFNYNFTTCSQLTENKMILMLRSIMYGRIENNNTCYIEWDKKEIFEKEVRLWEILLNKCKIRFNRNNRKYYIEFRLPRSKDVFLKSVFSYSYEEIRFIVDEIDRMNNMKHIIKPKDIDSLDFIQMVYALYGKTCYKKDDHLVRRNNMGTRLQIKEIDYFRTRYEYSFTTRSGYIVIRNNGIIYVFGDYKE